MKNLYMTLFKKIYESEQLTLAPLGIKFKKLSADVLATLLFTLLDFDDVIVEDHFSVTSYDVERLKYVYKAYRRCCEGNFIRVFLIAPEGRKCFYEFSANSYVVEDEDNDVIFRDKKEIRDDEEIIFTSKIDRDFFEKMAIKHHALILTFDNRRMSFYNGVLEDDVVDYSIFDLTRLEDVSPNPFVFQVLFHSIGLTHNELQFIEALNFVERRHEEKVIEYCNTKFIKSYIEAVLEKNFMHKRGRQGSRFFKINHLLDKYHIDLLKDLTFEKALKIYGE